MGGGAGKHSAVHPRVQAVREDRARKRSRSKSTGREVARSTSLGTDELRKKAKKLEKASKAKLQR